MAVSPAVKYIVSLWSWSLIAGVGGSQGQGWRFTLVVVVTSLSVMAD